MSRIDDTLAAVSAATRQVEESLKAIATAATEAHETHDVLAGAGAESAVELMGRSRDALDRAIDLGRSLIDVLEEAATAAEAAKG